VINQATINHLADALANAKARGHEWVQLVRTTRGGNSPRNWTRARVISARPSLHGRCIGAGNICGSWIFDVRIAELESFLEAHRP
jgi:hypothetical protein